MAQEEVVYGTRITIFTGEVSSFRFAPSVTFAQIKEELWMKKNFDYATREAYIFRLTTGEVVFEDDKTFRECLDVSPLFAEEARKQLVELCLVPVNQHPRRGEGDGGVSNSSPVMYEGGVVMKEGFLHKRARKSAAKWNKRYFVIQDMRMFWFENPNDYKNSTTGKITGKEACGAIPLGACTAVVLDDKTHSKSGSNPPLVDGTTTNFKEMTKRRISTFTAPPKPKFYFELRGLDRELVLYANTEEERNEWIDMINRLNMRRTKAAILYCVATMTQEGRGLKTEGLFRKVGDREAIDYLQREIDVGRFPENTSMFDTEGIHNVAALFKQILKNMRNPLLTFDLYNDFFFTSEIQDKAELRHELMAVANRLPVPQQALTRFVLKFLADVTANIKLADREWDEIANVMLRQKDDTLTGVTPTWRKVGSVVRNLTVYHSELWQQGGNEHYRQHRKTVVSAPSLGLGGVEFGGTRAETEQVALWRQTLTSSFTNFGTNFTMLNKDITESWNLLLDEANRDLMDQQHRNKIQELIGADEQFRRQMADEMMKHAQQIKHLQGALENNAQVMLQEQEAARQRKQAQQQNQELKAHVDAQLRAYAQQYPGHQLDLVRAIHPYEGDQGYNDLPMAVGDVVLVTSRQGLWFDGRNLTGQEGVFPANYVESIAEFKQRLGLR